jgi:aryl-alcohol dehydrogenase-like predicted oxidoreductase
MKSNSNTEGNDSHASRIVLGGGSYLEIPPTQLEKICDTARNSGVLRIDTAPCYANSEKLIGDVLSGDLSFKIKTKVCRPHDKMLSESDVYSSVESSLKNLKRDSLECVLLHELNLSQVKPEALNALLKLKEDGITEKIGVSSDNEALFEFAELGIFDTFMSSLNLTDLSNLELMRQLSENPKNTLVAKRTVANGVWRKDLRYSALQVFRTFRKEIDRQDNQSYLFRHKTLSSTYYRRLTAEDYMNFAFSWNLKAEVLLGTKNIEHLKQFRGIEKSERLSDLELEALEANWKTHAFFNWRAQV